jgi:hypothetical protein
MVSAVIFAHYIFIMAERYCYIVDYHGFGIPLSKRLANNTSNFAEIEYAQMAEASKQSGLTKNGSMGHYFITCKNCMHPVSNYMLNENCVHAVTHNPGGADDTQREGGEPVFFSPQALEIQTNEHITLTRAVCSSPCRARVEALPYSPREVCSLREAPKPSICSRGF